MSMAMVPKDTRWLEMRLSSQAITRQYSARVGYQRNGGPSGSGPTFGVGFATGKLHIDFAQIFTDAGAGSGKPTFLSLRYVF